MYPLDRTLGAKFFRVFVLEPKRKFCRKFFLEVRSNTLDWSSKSYKKIFKNLTDEDWMNEWMNTQSSNKINNNKKRKTRLISFKSATLEVCVTKK